MRLFFAEVKKVIISIPFAIFVVFLIGFHFTQYAQEVVKIDPPLPNQETYGYTQKEVPDVIIPAALTQLKREFEQNSYVAYPFSFYKEVHLKDKDKQKMAEMIEKLNVNMQYMSFVREMDRVDALIGGKSSYASDALVRNFGAVEKTYEDALEEYQLMKEEDQFSGAYARYFADYTGIALLILPIFIVVGFVLKDQTSRTAELIYGRSISSSKLIVTRFLAIVSAIFVPVLFLAVIETYRLTTMYPVEQLNLLAFFMHSIGWLLPTILFVVALGYFITEWSGTILAIVIQFVLFFVSISISMQQIMGGYSGWMLSIRHNTIGNTAVFSENIHTLLMNRLFYTAAAFICIGLTVVLYEKKRKGMPTSYEWFKQFIQNCSR